jgi:hypothetical protein
VLFDVNISRIPGFLRPQPFGAHNRCAHRTFWLAHGSPLLLTPALGLVGVGDQRFILWRRSEAVFENTTQSQPDTNGTAGVLPSVGAANPSRKN